MTFSFEVTATDGKARVGVLKTPHGDVQTPCFMPVGTHGAVKGVSPSELEQIGSQVVLANTYHLHLRPGEEIVKNSGGLHGFTGYRGPMLTDSGGFQVFSLGERGMDGRKKKALRKVTEDGITFRSHIDGSLRFISPEKSIEIQQALGADIIMAFDQPVYGMSDTKSAAEAMERSMRWLDRSITQWKAGRGDQALFGIVQGGIHKELHTRSAEFVVSKDLPGNAIGGLSVGESKEEMWEATESITSLLPENKPRYFMGLGDPTDVIEATMRGVDMYDCVAPSRLARHGVAWMLTGDREIEAAFWAGDTSMLLQGKLKVERYNMLNSRFATDYEPLVGVHTPLPLDLQEIPRSALHHHLKLGEMLAYRVLTLHNIALLHKMTEHMRNAIPEKNLSALYSVFYS